MFILLHRRRTVPRMNSQRTTIMMRGMLDNDVQILGAASVPLLQYLTNKSVHHELHLL